MIWEYVRWTARLNATHHVPHIYEGPILYDRQIPLARDQG